MTTKTSPNARPKASSGRKAAAHCSHRFDQYTAIRQKSGITEGAIQLGCTWLCQLKTKQPKNNGPPLLKSKSWNGSRRPRRQNASAAHNIATKKIGCKAPVSSTRNLPTNV